MSDAPVRLRTTVGTEDYPHPLEVGLHQRDLVATHAKNIQHCVLCRPELIIFKCRRLECLLYNVIILCEILSSIRGGKIGLLCHKISCSRNFLIRESNEKALLRSRQSGHTVTGKKKFIQQKFGWLLIRTLKAAQIVSKF